MLRQPTRFPSPPLSLYKQQTIASGRRLFSGASWKVVQDTPVINFHKLPVMMEWGFLWCSCPSHHSSVVNLPKTLISKVVFGRNNFLVCHHAFCSRKRHTTHIDDHTCPCTEHIGPGGKGYSWWPGSEKLQTMLTTCPDLQNYCPLLVSERTIR